MRIAKGLASQYELTIVDGWPMPALGVDCFVMETRDDASLEQLDSAACRPIHAWSPCSP